MARALRNRKAAGPAVSVAEEAQGPLEVGKMVKVVGKTAGKRNRKGVKMVVEKIATKKEVEIPSSTAGSAVLGQEVGEEVAQEGENGDVEMVDEGDVKGMGVDGEEMEESQTLLDIRREAAEALAREDQDGEEAAAPPSSQPRPAVTQESTEEDEEAEDDQEGESFDGEYSYGDLSENFSAQDGDADDTEGLDLEAFEYDPKDKEFLEELLAVAPEEEKDLLRRLSVVKGVEGENDGEGEVNEDEKAEETTTRSLTAKAERFLPLAEKHIREQAIWRVARNKSSKPKFSKSVYDYALQKGKLSHEEAATIVRAMHKTWASDGNLVKKRTREAKKKLEIIEAAAQRKRQSKREARQKELAERRRLEKLNPLPSKEEEDEEAAAQLAVEEALKSLEDAKTRALRKRKRTPGDDKEDESTSAPVVTESETTSNQPVEKFAAEPKIKLVGAQDWYSNEKKTDDIQQPTKKKAKKAAAKKGPVVSAHFSAPSAKTIIPQSAPSTIATTEDVAMEDVSENISKISVEIKQSVVQERSSSFIGNTADDEDRPITFSGGGGNLVERVLRAEETITPVSIQPSVLTHQIEESKVLIPTQRVYERPKKGINAEARITTGQNLKQQTRDEEMALKKMAHIARTAVQAAKRTVMETVAKNELEMPAVKKLEREAKALEFKAKSIEDKNNSRTKRPRNNNKLKVEPPKQKPKVNLPQAKKSKAVPVVDDKAKKEFLAAREQKNNDPAVVAQRLAEGLSAKGKKLRKTRGGKNKDPKSVAATPNSVPAPPVSTPAVSAPAAKVNASTEKPNGVVKALRSRRGGKNKAAPVAVKEVSKDHHS